jgi:uncharacterized RDD family membrane protein YckC
VTQPSPDTLPDDPTEWTEVLSENSPAGRRAALGRRLGARAVDFGVWGAAFALVPAPWWVLAAGAAGWLVVPVWLGGATAGKWLFGIRVATPDGTGLTPGRALAREAFVFGSFVIPLIAVLNTMVVVNDPRRQGFHDKLARSVVVGRR